MTKDNNLLALKMSMDNAVLELKAKEKGLGYIPEIQMSAQAYPYVPDRLFVGADSSTAFGAFYLVLIPLAVYMILYDEMIREKVNNLRIGLLLIGCSNAAFWISWIITGVLFSVVMSVLMYIFGYLYGFPFFVQSPFYIIFLFIFSVSVSFVSMAAALTTMMSTQAMAYTISYMLILVSVITVASLSDALIIYKLFYNIDMPGMAT